MERLPIHLVVFIVLIGIPLIAYFIQFGRELRTRLRPALEALSKPYKGWGFLIVLLAISIGILLSKLSIGSGIFIVVIWILIQILIRRLFPLPSNDEIDGKEGKKSEHR